MPTEKAMQDAILMAQALARAALRGDEAMARRALRGMRREELSEALFASAYVFLGDSMRAKRPELALAVLDRWRELGMGDGLADYDPGDR